MIEKTIESINKVKEATHKAHTLFPFCSGVSKSPSCITHGDRLIFFSSSSSSSSKEKKENKKKVGKGQEEKGRQDWNKKTKFPFLGNSCWDDVFLLVN